MKIRRGSLVWLVWNAIKTLAVVFALWAFVVLLGALA